MTARDARVEARARLGAEIDVRVLEPSPPAIHEPPFFADDPLAGGAVIPVDRAGSRSWTSVCDERDDDALRAWCAERWLVRGPLPTLPATFGATRRALHALAEHVIAPARWFVNGKIGLRYTFRGFGTPFFGTDQQARIEDGSLVVDDRDAVPITSLRAAAERVGIKPGAPTDVYIPTTSIDIDDELAVDVASARVLGDWFGFGASLLEQMRADAADDERPGRVQIWPEHFDIAVDLGVDGYRANFGASPGDDQHTEPYLYVGPWEPRTGPFWNESWGASLSYSDIVAGADPLEFLRNGKASLRE